MNRHLAERRRDVPIWQGGQIAGFHVAKQNAPKKVSQKIDSEGDVIMQDIIRDVTDGKMDDAVDKLGHYLQKKYADPNPLTDFAPNT